MNETNTVMFCPLHFISSFLSIVSPFWQVKKGQSGLVCPILASRGRSYHAIKHFHQQWVNGLPSISLFIMAFYLMCWQRLNSSQVFCVHHLWSIYIFVVVDPLELEVASPRLICRPCCLALHCLDTWWQPKIYKIPHSLHVMHMVCMQHHTASIFPGLKTEQ